MKQNKNKGFTLVETIITITLSTVLLTGVMYFMTEMVSSITGIYEKNISFDAYTDFKEDLDLAISNYPEYITHTGGITKDDKYGFDAIAYKNKSGDSGFILGALDKVLDVNSNGVTIKNYHILIGNKSANMKYTNITPFIYYIDRNTIYDIGDKDKLKTFIDKLNKKLENNNLDRFIRPTNLSIIKLDYERLTNLTPQKGELSIVITPKYFEKFFGFYIKDIIDKKIFKSYFINFLM